jgi:hypothetical protein
LKKHLLTVSAAGLVLLLAGCGGDGESVSPATVTSEIAQQDAIPVPPSTDPEIVLPAIVSAMNAAGSWQVEAQLVIQDVTEDGEQSLVTNITAARSGPGTNIVVTNSSATTGSISGSTSAENRVVDDKRYRRDPNSGEWTVSDASNDAPGLTIDAGVVSQVEVSTATITITELDGEQVFHVAGTVPGVDAAEAVEVFAGVDDNLVRKILLSGRAPGSNFGGLLAISERLLPQTVEAYYLEYGRPIVVHIPPDIENDGFAETRTYLSTINPFSMEIPGDMNQSTRTELIGDRFNGTGGEVLFIIEEYLDVDTAYVGELAGKSPDVETYARRFEIELEQSDTYDIVSNEVFTTDSGLEARILRFTESDGAIQWSHLSYFSGDDLGFGATYGAFSARYQEIEDSILEAFRSFVILE